jgi:putative protein-disulfide isomerase
MKTKLKIIYVYDALCGWCYGFSPVMQAVHETFAEEFEFEVLSGGLVPGNPAEGMHGKMEPSKDSFEAIEEVTGISFGTAFIHNYEWGKIVFNAEWPAIALSVLKSILPDRSMEFAHQIQNSIFYDGKSPDDLDLYRYLAVNNGIDPDIFERKMKDPGFKDAAYYESALAKQLNVSSFPAVFIQASESSFYLIAKGYADYETMELRINNVRLEIGY